MIGKNTSSLLATLVALAGSAMLARPATASEHTQLITYGLKATPSDGDDRFKQLFIVRIPDSVTEPVYLRIFDADCGADLDQVRDGWDTRTRFRLFGGPAATEQASLTAPVPTAAAWNAGVPLADETFGVSAELNQKWHVLAVLKPPASGGANGVTAYKLLVEGIAGNDGNAFDVDVSLAGDRGVDVPGAEILSYAPTLRLNQEDMQAELRFGNGTPLRGVRLHSFDLGGAKVTVDTPTATYAVPVTDGDAWQETRITFSESGVTEGAVVFGGGHELPNDVSFYLEDQSGKPLPFYLPLILQRTNHRPDIRADVQILSDCRSAAFDATQTRDEDGDALSFAWDFGDASQGSGPRLTHTYPDTVPRVAHLLVRDNSGTLGNGSRKDVAVNLNTPPNAAIRGPSIAAPNLPVTWDGSASTDAEGPIKTYSWDYGDGNHGLGGKSDHIYRVPGHYNVSLTVTDAGKPPCNTASSAQPLWVNAPPTAAMGHPTVGAAGEELHFSAAASHDSDGKLVNYVWNFGDGKTQTGAEVNHAFAAPGDYGITLTVHDDAQVANSSAEAHGKLHINTPPVAVAKTSLRRAAVGQVVQFDASASRDADGHIEAYEWDFGDGSHASGAQVAYAYDHPGTFTATLSVQDDSGTHSSGATQDVQVVVNAAPVARAGEDRVVLSSEVPFDASMSSDSDGLIQSYVWDFGDGASASGQKAVHVYGNTGVYDVSLKVVDDSGTPNHENMARVRVHVNAMPVADAGPDRVTAPGARVQFTAAESFDPDGHILEPLWDFGDGHKDKGGQVTHAFAKPGDYTVRLTVRDDSGHPDAVDYDDVVVHVNSPPHALAGQDVVVAVGDTVTLDARQSYDADGSIVAYQWQLSHQEGGAEGPILRHRFTRPGVYNATLTVIDDSGAPNGVSQDSLMVHVNYPPQAVPGKDILTCDMTVGFDASQSYDPDQDALSYKWDFGDGSPRNAGVSVEHTYAQAGTYPVVLEVDDGRNLANSKNSAALQLTINRPAIAKAGKDKVACAGEVVLLNGGGSSDPEGGRLKYLWNLGDGTTATDVNPTKVYTRGGTYQVMLTTEDDSGLRCSKSSDQIVIRVAESPVAKAGPDQTACANTEVHFDGSESHDADGLVNAFAWEFGDGLTGGGATPSHVYQTPGVYKVVLTVTGDQIGDCDNTARDGLKVTVYEAPVAKFTVPKLVAIGEPISFDSSASTSQGTDITGRQWSFGDGEKASGERVQHAFSKAGRYMTELTVSTAAATRCNSTSMQNLVVVNAPPAAKMEHPPVVAISDVVVFDGHASVDTDGSIVKYMWDFGDGTSGSGVEARHQYKGSGKFKVSLKVVDDTSVANNSDTAASTVWVNDPPQAVITLPGPSCAGAPLALSASKSRDSDGQIKSYKWTFGDGQNGSGADVTHAYAEPGRYQVALTVDDGLGVSNSVEENSAIVVVNSPPQARLEASHLSCPNEPVHFDASQSRDIDASTLAYSWDLGDGSKQEGKTIDHAYGKPGTYNVKLRVTDDSKSACATSDANVAVVVNAPPTARAGGDRKAFAGGAHDAVLFDATSSEDPDGGRLTYLWDFGDGTTEQGAKVFHAYLKGGRYQARLHVRDDSHTRCAEAVDVISVDVVERK